MKKLNNKGFTLVELLAVVAILVIIMLVAIPNISSSIERTRNKQDEGTKKIIESAARLYYSKYRGTITSSDCKISVNTLKDEGYLGDEDVSNFNGCVIYDGTSLGNYTETCSQSECHQ